MLEARSAYGYFGSAGGCTGENEQKRKKQKPKRKVKITMRDRWGTEYDTSFPYRAGYTKEKAFAELEKIDYFLISFEIVAP